MDGRRRRRFELAAVVAVAGIVAGVLLERVVPLLARSERIAFEHVRGRLQSALVLEAADRIAHGESGSLRELAGGNPMELLLKTPGNYLGRLDVPEPEDVPRSHWYFDATTHRLVYRAGRFAEIETDAGRVDRIELRVRLEFRDRNGNGRFDAGRDGFGGLRLEPVSDYDWLDIDV